jgi:DNA-binding beta-propeller fold protein YncE
MAVATTGLLVCGGIVTTAGPGAAATHHRSALTRAASPDVDPPGVEGLATACTGENTCTLDPVNTTSDSLGSPIKLPEEGYDIAVTPSGSTAFVTGGGGGDHVVPVNLGTDKAGAVIPTVESARVSISPDGTTAYMIAGGGLTPVNTATHAIESAYTGETTYLTGGLALAPGGNTIYASEENVGVLPFSTTTGTAGNPITVGSGFLDAFAITPDGSTLYATDSSADELFPVNLTSQTAGAGISVPQGPQDVAVTADGATVVTANANGTVTTIATSSDTVQHTVVVCPSTAPNAQAISIAPDGTTALVACNGFTTTYVADLVPFDIATATPGTPISLPSGNQINDVAFVPDQSPVASMAVSGASVGSSTSFSAAKSSPGEYPITSYNWNFGDGDTAVTSGPTTSHSYTAIGNYIATVTETDSVGTSTTQVYTGQTAGRNGRPVAEDSQPVSIASTACTKEVSCSTQVTTSKVKATVSGTPTGSGASLLMTDIQGSLACETKGFLDTSDVVQVQPTGFPSGSPLDVSEEVQDVLKGSNSKVCYQGSSGPASVLPKCGKSGPAPCVSGTTSTKTADTFKIEVISTEIASLYITNTFAAVAKAFKPIAAAPGATVTVKGKDLPPSKTMSFSFSGTGGTSVQSPVESSSTKSLTTTVPSTALSGPVFLTLNGETTTSVKSITIK